MTDIVKRYASASVMGASPQGSSRFSDVANPVGNSQYVTRGMTSDNPRILHPKLNRQPYSSAYAQERPDAAKTQRFKGKMNRTKRGPRNGKH